MVSESTRICHKHFLPQFVHKALGGTRRKRLPGGEPVLHEWNNFSLPKKSRKDPPIRKPLPIASIPSDHHHMPRSPTPPLNISDTGNTLLEDPEQDPDLDDPNFDFVVRGASDIDVIISDDEFEDITEGHSYNEQYQYEGDDNNNNDDDNNNNNMNDNNNNDNSTDDLREKVFSLTERVTDLEIQLAEAKDREMQLNLKLVPTELPFVEEILKNDTSCNHYTGFPSLVRMRAIFEFLDAGPSGRNIICIKIKKIKKLVLAGDQDLYHPSIPFF